MKLKKLVNSIHNIMVTAFLFMAAGFSFAIAKNAPDYKYFFVIIGVIAFVTCIAHVIKHCDLKKKN